MGRKRCTLRLVGTLLVLLVLGSALLPAQAQTQPQRIEVFVEQRPDSNTARIYFMDTLSGLSTVASVESGHGFVLLGDYVLYEKSRTGAVMRVNVDGTLEPHPFIRRAVDTVQIDWVVSQDRRAVAWTLVNAVGESAAFVAWADGSDLRQLPLQPEQERRALFPLALTSDRSMFFYDAAHPLPSEDAVPYTVFHHMVRYGIDAETMFPIPNEPNCPCAAAVTSNGRNIARLEAESGLGPFALHMWDLPSGADIRVAAPQIALRQAGNLVLNSNGTRAVYSAAAGVGIEAGILPEQYALIVVDVGAGVQRMVLLPGPDRYRPLAFIDGDTALLLMHEVHGGTYKLDLERAELQHVSDKRYLGTITL